jgi:DNA-binding NtrC family response regulator
VAEWVTITEGRDVQTAQLAQNESQRDDGLGHRKPGGKSEAARKLGMTRKTVERSLKINGLSDKAKTNRQ